MASVKESERARADETDKAVREVYNAFTAAIPARAQSSGAHEVPKDEWAAAARRDVPDGRYRVLGADWIMQFKGGRLIAAVRANEQTSPAGIVTVPPANG
jgi:hypothetical protein